jgi:hypothetical protein
MPAKKKPSAPKKRARGKVGLTSAIGPKATTAVVICVIAGGLAVGAHQQAAKAKELEAAAALVPISRDSTAPSTPSRPSAPARAASGPSRVSSAPPDTGVRAVASTKTPDVTITGCLERADEGFRLTSTEGANAPKSRSWKSGFLKKGAAAVDVVDVSHELALASQVGRRVSITGTLVDRQLQASGMRRVASSCKAG